MGLQAKCVKVSEGPHPPRKAHDGQYGDGARQPAKQALSLIENRLGRLPKEDHGRQRYAGCDGIGCRVVMAGHNRSEPGTKRRTYHSAVLNEEQDGQHRVPEERLAFRDIKTDRGNGSDDQKYSEKKERSPADEDGQGHHRVCGKTVHRRHPLQDFRVQASYSTASEYLHCSGAYSGLQTITMQSHPCTYGIPVRSISFKYSGIFINPSTGITQSFFLFRLSCSPGDMSVQQVSPHVPVFARMP